ncbi:hypothetical protein CA233_20220 [Sphingomonas sp. ABOLD]|nr:hypothetical protein CA233_20220 [Sphingomonas sp. ABOLD]
MGWVVEVEHPEGALLYVVAVDEPSDAEDRLRALLAIPADRDVCVHRRLATLPFDMEAGAIKGPM